MMLSSDWRYIPADRQHLPPWPEVGTRPALLVLWSDIGRSCVFRGSVPRDFLSATLMRLPDEEQRWWRYLLSRARGQGWDMLGYWTPYLRYEMRFVSPRTAAQQQHYWTVGPTWTWGGTARQATP